MTGLDNCPYCNHKSAYWRGAWNSYRCNHCFVEFILENSIPTKISHQVDKWGNEYAIEVKKNIAKRTIKVIKTFYLREGQTELNKGFNSDYEVLYGK